MIEALGNVLSMMDKKISELTEKQLDKQKIQLMANTFVKVSLPQVLDL